MICNRYAEESELSPRSRPPSRSQNQASNQKSDIAPWGNDSSEIAPWEKGPSNSNGAQGATLTGVRSVEDFPAPQWGSMSNFSNGDDMSPSPTLPEYVHPGMVSDGALDTNDHQTSGNTQNLSKISSFFGEDPDDPKPPNLQTPQPTTPDSRGEDKRPGYARQLSWGGSKKSKPSSPDGSRPRTPPQASSEVTPWAYQDHAVSQLRTSPQKHALHSREYLLPT